VVGAPDTRARDCGPPPVRAVVRSRVWRHTTTEAGDDATGSNRADAEPDEPEGTVRPHVAAAVPIRGEVVDQCDRRRDDERAGDSLEDTEGHQVPVRRRQRVRETRRDENKPEQDEHLPSPGSVGEPPGKRLEGTVDKAENREYEPHHEHIGQPEAVAGDKVAGDEQREDDDGKGVADRLGRAGQRERQHLRVDTESVSQHAGERNRVLVWGT
jgi:hypothetical protein